MTADPKDGPLPGLLLVLTVVTGLVDSVSILSLGRVFVANMTGNVVFVGFALAGAPGFLLSASLFALAGFLVGAGAGGALIGRMKSDRAMVFFASVGLELTLVAAAAVVAQVAAVPYSNPVKDVVAGITAIALGLQNSMARHVAVPDLTTTVLTMTLTGLASDVRKRNPATAFRRLLAVATMLGGAIAGALLVIHVRPSAALEGAAGLIAFTAIASLPLTRKPSEWRTSREAVPPAHPVSGP